MLRLLVKWLISTWSTATETNNRGFEIQRSSQGNGFVTIGFVQGKGTTTQAQRYVFVDNNVRSWKISISFETNRS